MRARGTTGLTAAIMVLAAGASAPAASLPPGGAVTLPGSASPGGVILRDVLVPFEIVDADDKVVFAGNIHDRVVRKPDGTLVFLKRVRDTLVDAPSGMVSAAVIDYAGLTTDVDWDPFLVGGDAPSVATRSGDGSDIVFSFATNPIYETEESEFFYVDTNTEEWDVFAAITLAVDSGESTVVNVASPIFDDTPPEVEIIEPSPFTCICTLFDITGIAWDPDGAFGFYQLEYRAVNDPTWSLITTSTLPVPPPGGVLGTWNTSGLAHGYYFLRLTAENSSGLSSAVITIALVDKVFDNFLFNGPSGIAVGGDVCPNGIIDDACTEEYVVQYSADGINYLDINPGMPIYTGPKVNQTFAVWDSTVVADGTYTLLVKAYDPCGNSASDIVEIIVDNTPPTAVIDSPISCDCVDGIVEVYGTAHDENLLGWVLQYTGGNQNGWVTISSGTTSVFSGLLGTWDTSALPECCHTLRLLVSDNVVVNCNGAVNHHSEFLVAVDVGCSGCSGDVNGDNVVDISDLLLILAGWGACR